MQTDEWRTIEADPHYRDAHPEKKAAMAALYKHVTEKKKPPPKKQKPSASLLDEVKALMPEAPNEHPADRAAREQRLAAPPSSNALHRFVRSAREAIPAAASSGVSSALIADTYNKAQTNALRPQRQMIPTRTAQQEPEPGILDALRDVVADPRRLVPGSPGFVEGVGAVVPNVIASTIDPAGAALGGLAFKGAGAAVKGAAKQAAKQAAKVNVPAPVKNFLLNESGQAMPGWEGRVLKHVLDRGDDAFEAAGQATMRAGGEVADHAKAALNTAAARAAAPGQRVGDVLHIPKQAAEDVANALARRIDLKGRTGHTADEWYDIAKHQPVTTPYAPVNALLNNTRKYLASDYGVTPEMKAIEEAARVYGNNTARPLEELAVRMNKERTGAEQHDIHWLTTESEPMMGPMNAQTFVDSLAVKNASRTADKMLEDVGALPQGMTDLYDGTHLPRDYAKHWFAEGKTNPFARTADNKIGGYYRRGKSETITKNELLARQASEPVTGEKWNVLKEHGDLVDVHRDWTIPERQKWGEIRNIGSALQQKAIKARREGQSAYILNEYAKPEAGDASGRFAFKADDFADEGVRPKERLIDGKKYVLLDDRAAKESGIPIYGNLANHYVRDDVAFYLWNHNELKPFIDKINKYSLNNLWKKSVTIGNAPGYFVNNFFQNPLILERTGGSMMDMPAAWNDLANNSINIQRLEEAGVIKNGVLARELGAQMKHFNDTLSSEHMHTGFSIGKQMLRASKALRAYEQNAYRIADASDDLYRVALAEGLMRREGKTFEEAAAIAKEAFYNSEHVTSPAAQIASIVSPFSKVMWWAADNEAKAWTRDPGKAAYINSLMAALPIAANFAMGKSREQQKAEEQSLPENMRGFGNNFPTPMSDEKGNYYLDANNWNHYNQFKPIDNTAASVKLPIDLPIQGDMVGYPRGLAPGGPAMTALQMASNTDWYTGRPIVERTEDNEVISDNRANFLNRQLVPGVARNGAALYGTMTGESDPPVNALSDSIRKATGFKTQPANTQEGVKRNTAAKGRDLRDIGMAISREKKALARAMEAGNKGAVQNHIAELERLAKLKAETVVKSQERNRTMMYNSDQEDQ